VPWSSPFCGNSSANSSSIPSEWVLPTRANAAAAPELGRGLEHQSVRRGWETRVHSALRREGKLETLLLSMTAQRIKGRWRQTLLRGAQ